MSTLTPDRFVSWPVYAGIKFLVITNALFLLPLPPPWFVLLLPPLVLLVVIAVGLIGFAICNSLLALFRWHWRRAVSMMAIPIIIVVTFPLTDIPKSVRDAFRFQIHKGRYEIEVAKAREAGRHFTVVDDWSVFATANFFVVWDDADKPEEVMSGFTPQRHFGDHFYLVGETQ